MLDLKAKLLQAGLVTDDQVEKVQAEQEADRARKKAARSAQGGKGPKGKGPRGKKGGGKKGGPRPAAPQKSDDERWAARVKQLAEGGKSEQYDAIRGWVERTRLDAEKAIPTENAERFHFSTYDGTISWLTLEPELIAKLKDNSAAISAFMSFNGLRHCVLPAEVAKDIAKIRPEWPRVLEGAEILTRPPPEPKEEGEAKDGDETANASAATDAAAPVTSSDAQASEASADSSAAEGVAPENGATKNGATEVDAVANGAASNGAMSNGAAATGAESKGAETKGAESNGERAQAPHVDASDDVKAPAEETKA